MSDTKTTIAPTQEALKNALVNAMTPHSLLSMLSRNKDMTKLDVNTLKDVVVDEFNKDQQNQLESVSSLLAELMLGGEATSLGIDYVQYIAVINTRHGTDLLIGYAPKGQHVDLDVLLDFHQIDKGYDFELVEFKEKHGVRVDDWDDVIPE